MSWGGGGGGSVKVGGGGGGGGGVTCDQVHSPHRSMTQDQDTHMKD